MAYGDPSCNGNCTEACGVTCTSTCSGSCLSCGSGCGGNCSGGCSGGCSGSCNNTCKDGCSGGCKGCTNTCKNDCDVGCKGQAMDTLAKDLKLHEYIEQQNIQDIMDLVAFELTRRGKIPTLDTDLRQYTTYVVKKYFNHMQTNLAKINITTTYTNNADETVLKAMAQQILTKALEAHDEKIKNK